MAFLYLQEIANFIVLYRIFVRFNRQKVRVIAQYHAGFSVSCCVCFSVGNVFTYVMISAFRSCSF